VVGKKIHSCPDVAWNRGKSPSQETRDKISLSKKGTVIKNHFTWKGKKRPPITEEWRNNLRKSHLGHKQSVETIEKRRLKMTGRKRPEFYKVFGKEKHWNWKGGISNNPYPKEFNPQLKLKIRTRDNFISCLCGRTEREELEELNRVLCVNHIDFDKNNCSENNLNTLCVRCNVKVNREREHWTDYFKNNE